MLDPKINGVMSESTDAEEVSPRVLDAELFVLIGGQ